MSASFLNISCLYRCLVSYVKRVVSRKPCRSSCNVFIIFVWCSQSWNVLTQFSKTPKYLTYWKSVTWFLGHYVQTDRQAGRLNWWNRYVLQFTVMNASEWFCYEVSSGADLENLSCFVECNLSTFLKNWILKTMKFYSTSCFE